MAKPSCSEYVAHNRPFAAFCALVALLCSLYCECFRSIVLHEQTGVAAGLAFGSVTVGTLVRVGGAFALLLAAIYLAATHKGALRWLLAHRVPLGVALVALLTLMQISGSSIGMWATLPGEEANNGVLFGMPRAIRSDEWCVYTPFSFAQAATGNHAVSSAIRGGGTDVTMIYAQPCWSLATLFRPFLWGYLVLGVTRGLSFYWCARAVVLLLVTFEFMLLLTERDRHVAAYATVLVGFAPIVEWWFAVNGTVELLVFGEGLVLCLHRFLRAAGGVRRWAWAGLLAWLLGCYALIIYPAWQIPFVYVFGCVGIWDLATWLRSMPQDKRPRPLHVTGPLAAAAALAALAILACVWLARDAIAVSSGTVYPGERFFVGGTYLGSLFNSTTAPISALWPEHYTGNVCESAAFISLFPLGALLALTLLAVSALRHSIDYGIVALLAPYVFLLAFGILGFPAPLAKATLMSYVLPGRLALPLGFLDVALLARSLALLPKVAPRDAVRQRAPQTSLHGPKFALPVVACLVFVGVLVALAALDNPQLMHRRAIVTTAALLTALAVPVFLHVFSAGQGRCAAETWLLVSALVPFVCGMCVNPVQIGASALLNSHIAQGVGAVRANDPDALWLTDSSVIGQACIATGAPTINSVNVYPNMERWHAIDPSGTYEDVYNRYATILVNPGTKTEFTLLQNDMFELTIAPDDVPKLGATYWLSAQDLTQWSTEHVRFEPRQQAGAYTVYLVRSV